MFLLTSRIIIRTNYPADSYDNLDPNFEHRKFAQSYNCHDPGLCLPKVITEQASATAFCNATNYADGANEEGLKQVMFDNGASNSNSLTFARQIVDAEACCQACSANPACSAWFFLDDKYGCRFYQSTTGKCNNGDFTFSVGLDGPAGSGFTVGNGNCGDFDDTYECETCG
jgi:hypothetical protein